MDGFRFCVAVTPYALPAIVLATVLGLLSLVPHAAAQDHDWDVEVDMTMEEPVVRCTAREIRTLHFGTIHKPASGSNEYVEIDVLAATVSTSTGISDPASFSVGSIDIEGEHGSGFTVTPTFPSDLDGLVFAGTWATYDSLITATSHTFSYPGGPSYKDSERYYFGGKVEGIGTTTTNGTYDDQIVLSISCF